MKKLMGDEGWGGGACFSLLTPSVCVQKCIWKFCLLKSSAASLINISVEANSVYSDQTAYYMDSLIWVYTVWPRCFLNVLADDKSRQHFCDCR